MAMDIRNASHGSRYREIDTLRGIAIVMMVVFHSAFDLHFYNILAIDVHGLFWRTFALCTASLFVLLVGVSLSISQARASPQCTGFELHAKYFRRGLQIFLLGILISIATFLYLGDGFVLFGILHLIGVSIIIAPFFFRFRTLNFFIGYGIIIAGFFMAGLKGPIWLAWIGIHPATFYSVDYEPLIPWFGVILIGYYIGTILYPSGLRRFSLPEITNPLAGALAYLGERSLFIYIVHQPIIVGFLLLLTSFPGI